jgi:large subunit ribosomal protein L25
MTYTLKIEKREAKEKPETLRKAGFTPAIMYGPKFKSTAIKLNSKDFEKVFKKAGESTVIELTGVGETEDALIHELDLDPVTDIVRHVDFYVIEKGKKVKVKIPIVFEGVAPAVKEKGGILVKVMRDLEIQAGVKDLPHEIKVDISSLVDLNSHIAAKDVNLPKGVELVAKPEEVVASISVAKEEPIEAPTVDLSAIEVEKKGKEEKEGEAGAADASKKE